MVFVFFFRVFSVFRVPKGLSRIQVMIDSDNPNLRGKQSMSIVGV